MKDLTMFILPNCPHCKLALKFQQELIEENPEFGKINITMIDESAQPEIADKYDYYYVPCWFSGKEKLFEGHAEKADVEKVLRAAAK